MRRIFVLVLLLSVALAAVPHATQAAALNGERLYINLDNQVIRQIIAWQSQRLSDAVALIPLALQPETRWFGDWNTAIATDVAAYISAAERQRALPTLVAYNIPFRDCGSYSAGGAAARDAYLTWVRGMATGIGSRKAVVILEPDALAGMDCLSATARQDRITMLREAVSILKQNPQTVVYIDAGHSAWIEAQVMATRLRDAGIAHADGFALNVSNFRPTPELTAYGEQLSRLTGGKHFVLDTSRNGNGATSDNAWCNPGGRRIGLSPTTATGHDLIDAYLWIKRPGESDGTCNGGPSAGVWWPEYALGLVRN